MREQFEAWMTSEQWFHEGDYKWDESRNCYAEYGIHIAFKAYLAATASMQAERDQLAAECAALNDRMQKLIQIINNADNNYCMCGEAMETHTHGGCGHPTGMFDYHYNAWLEADTETPATARFLAEQRASAIPEGYVLVPQQIFLDPSDIESICSQCGDGHESGYGDFTDGLLWVGNIQRDDGSIVHGLHISSADYTEEGGVTICEFAAQLRNEVKV